MGTHPSHYHILELDASKTILLQFILTFALYNNLMIGTVKCPAVKEEKKQQQQQQQLTQEQMEREPTHQGKSHRVLITCMNHAYIVILSFCILCCCCCSCVFVIR